MEKQNYHQQLQSRVLLSCNITYVVVALSLALVSFLDSQYGNVFIGVMCATILISSIVLTSIGEYTIASALTTVGMTLSFFSALSNAPPSDPNRIYIFPALQSITLILSGLLAQKRKFSIWISVLTLSLLLFYVFFIQAPAIGYPIVTIAASFAIIIVMSILSDQIFLLSGQIFNRYLRSEDVSNQRFSTLNTIINAYTENKQTGSKLEKNVTSQTKEIELLQNANNTILTNLSELQHIINDFISLNEFQGGSTKNISRIFSQHQNTMKEYKSTIDYLAQESQDVADAFYDKKAQLEEISTLTQQGQNKITDSINIVKKVKENHKNILDMITLIVEVAERTNVLALNAAVEASRAGKAGSGFAIVAKEIKNLSTETSQNADIINKTLHLNIKSIEETADVIQNADQALIQVVHIVEKFEQTLEHINNQINTLTNRSMQISMSTSNTTVILDEIQQIITSIIETIEQGTRRSLDMHQLSSRLLDQATLLQYNSNMIRENGHQTIKNYTSYVDSIKHVEDTIQKFSS